MNEDFKNLLIDTIQQLKNHPEVGDGVAFVTEFDEEPEWEVSLVFKRKITHSAPDTIQ